MQERDLSECTTTKTQAPLNCLGGYLGSLLNLICIHGPLLLSLCACMLNRKWKKRVSGEYIGCPMCTSVLKQPVNPAPFSLQGPTYTYTHQIPSPFCLGKAHLIKGPKLIGPHFRKASVLKMSLPLPPRLHSFYAPTLSINEFIYFEYTHNTAS